jgi:hypothetical protein
MLLTASAAHLSQALSCRRCCGCRDDATLRRHPESVRHDPAFSYFAVREPLDGPRSDGDVRGTPQSSLLATSGVPHGPGQSRVVVRS